MALRSTRVKRPHIPPELEQRLPPGQFLTQRWPVLHYGSVPPFDPATWDFRVFGLVARELRFSWEEFLALPRVTVTADLHCVTRWSKLDHTWEGVSARVVMRLAGVAPGARFVIFHADGDGGYTANLPIAVLEHDDVLFAVKHQGEPLSPEHGYPLRAVVPSRYGWKSAKWLRGIEFLAADRPGFWERHGYHMNADYRQEERFAE